MQPSVRDARTSGHAPRTRNCRNTRLCGPVAEIRIHADTPGRMVSAWFILLHVIARRVSWVCDRLASHMSDSPADNLDTRVGKCWPSLVCDLNPGNGDNERQEQLICHWSSPGCVVLVPALGFRFRRKRKPNKDDDWWTKCPCQLLKAKDRLRCQVVVPVVATRVLEN